ncbi:hypothetical protein VTN02DRAFT_1226 [Thermoascus thermophilus]
MHLISVKLRRTSFRINGTDPSIGLILESTASQPAPSPLLPMDKEKIRNVRHEKYLLRIRNRDDGPSKAMGAQKTWSSLVSCMYTPRLRRSYSSEGELTPTLGPFERPDPEFYRLSKVLGAVGCAVCALALRTVEPSLPMLACPSEVVGTAACR